MIKKYGFISNGICMTSDEEIEVRNPYNNEIIGIVCRPSPNDVEQSIASASLAFEKTKKMPSFQRSKILLKAASIIEKRKEEISKILCLEAGKPIQSSRGEVTRAVCTLTIAAEEAKRLSGETLPLDITPEAGNRLGIVRRFPRGLIAGISPFNFPLNLVCHKVAPALASGNTILIKPATSTPVSALLLGEILMEAGCIPGSINILPCSATVAEKMISNPKIRMITFTGSSDVGWRLKEKAGKKPVCLELGGNAAVIIEPDADLSVAAERSVLGGYAYAGQICISVQRIYIHEKVYEEFVELFINHVKNLKLGDPLLDDTDVGPMIDEPSAQRTEQWIDEAVSKGGELLTGGSRNGTLFAPTVMTDVPRDAKVSCQEVFAPVVILDSYKTFKEALEKVNDSIFGLQAGVFTKDIEKAFLAFNTIDVGGVIINDIPTYRVDSMPYGGVKDSGLGREGVKYAMEEMTELKIMVVNNGISGL
jgi:glyceraldehyde-3-phosphate dehydrogenase (NADP+)